MKLTDQTIAFVEQVIGTASLVNIENIIISSDSIRGIDEGRMVLICHNEDVPDFEFGSIGVDGKILTSRLNVVKGGKYSVNAEISGDSEFVRSLTLTRDKTKVDYRCMNPSVIQAPKKINDTLVYQVEFENELLEMLSKGKSAMGADVVAIVSDRTGVTCEMADVNDDKLSYEVADQVVNLVDEEDVNPLFIYRYPISIMMALLKQASSSGTNYFEIGQKGIMKIRANKLDFYVLPRA